MKLDADEKGLLPSVERGQWNSAGGAGSASGLATRDTPWVTGTAARCAGRGGRLDPSAATPAKLERRTTCGNTKATFRKDRRLDIRLSSKDLEAIEKPAFAEGCHTQTLISSLLHKYASGRLKEI